MINIWDRRLTLYFWIAFKFNIIYYWRKNCSRCGLQYLQYYRRTARNPYIYIVYGSFVDQPKDVSLFFRRDKSRLKIRTRLFVDKQLALYLLLHPGIELKNHQIFVGSLLIRFHADFKQTWTLFRLLNDDGLWIYKLEYFPDQDNASKDKTTAPRIATPDLNTISYKCDLANP